MDLLARSFKSSIVQRMAGVTDYPTFALHAKEIDNLVRKSAFQGSDSFYMESIANSSHCLKLTYDVLVLPVYTTEAEWQAVDFPLQLSRRVILKERVTNSIARGQKRSKARTIVNNNIRQAINSVRSKKSLNVDFVGKISEELLWFKEFHIKNSVTELIELHQKFVMDEDNVTSKFLNEARNAYVDLYKLVKVFMANHQNLMPEYIIHKLYKFTTNFSANKQSLDQSIAAPEVGYNSLFVTNSLTDCIEITDLFIKLYRYITEEIDSFLSGLDIGGKQVINYSNAFAVLASNSIFRPCLIYQNYLSSLYARLLVSDTVPYDEANNGVLALYKKLNSLAKAEATEIKKSLTLSDQFDRLGAKRLSNDNRTKPLIRTMNELEDIHSLVTEKVTKIENVLAGSKTDVEKRRSISRILTEYKRKMRQLADLDYLDY